MTSWAALSDPRRRAAMELLHQHPRSVGELSGALRLTQPATSKHLRVLREAGLVHVHGDAQRRIYAIDPAPLAELDAWLASYRALWAGALDALARHLERAPGCSRGLDPGERDQSARDGTGRNVSDQAGSGHVIETAHQPALAERSYRLSVQRTMPLGPDALYRAWTEQFDRWFAAPGSVLMTAAIDAPFYFQTDFGGRRNAHYGRFLRLDPGRLVELAWVSGTGGTEGAETVVTVELFAAGDATRVQLTHDGFPHAQARDAHQQAWPAVLAQMEEQLTTSPA